MKTGHIQMPSQNQSETNKTRLPYIDFLRILAVLMVIYIHTNERGFQLYFLQKTEILWIRDMSCAILSKSGVPIFFMISGVTLLGKNESIKETYKRIPRIIIDLILFSALYICAYNYHNDILIIPSEVIKQIISSDIWHIWYLYAYTAFLISLPILRRFRDSIDLKTFNYIVLICIILSGILPIIETFFIPIDRHIKPTWITSQIVLYPLAGYIIDRKIDISEFETKRLLKLWCINILCIIIDLICGWLFLKLNPSNPGQMFLDNFSLISSITIFITVKKIFSKHNPSHKVCIFISEAGKCTFGIYLLHYFILYFCFRFIKGVFDQPPGVYIACIIVFIVGGCISYVGRRIPLINKLL